MENPFNLPVSGQASWDDDVNLALQVFDRGYHVTERAGQAISSGQMLALTSGGWFLPFDPNSTLPCVGYSFTAAASGDSISPLAWGTVRSLDINSAALIGQLMFSNASGFLSASTLGAPVGMGLSGRGILFNPMKTPSYTRAHRVQSVQISAAQNSTHLFTMSLGNSQFGWNRRVRLNGSSMSLVELRFYKDAARSDLQYQTFSGGVSVVTSFHDRAGWPIDTDSGTIYGSLQCMSTGVTTDTINIIADWET
jgi:hypothetical protein